MIIMFLLDERMLLTFDPMFSPLIKIIMSFYIDDKDFSFFRFLEQKALFDHFSLNSCNNNTINSFFYFHIASYIFILLFSFVFFLLGILWGTGKEDLFLLARFHFYKNLLICYWIAGVDSHTLNRVSSYITIIYKELYEQDLNEFLNLKQKSIFWWEPWSYEILAFFPPFDSKFLNSPWHFYYKYRLSSWVRWHILEDRICIFVLFFLWILL